MIFPFLLLALFSIPIPAFATAFLNVTYHHCYDGDTCTFIPSGVYIRCIKMPRRVEWNAHPIKRFAIINLI